MKILFSLGLVVSKITFSEVGDDKLTFYLSFCSPNHNNDRSKIRPQ